MTLTLILLSKGGFLFSSIKFKGLMASHPTANKELYYDLHQSLSIGTAMSVAVAIKEEK